MVAEQNGRTALSQVRLEKTSAAIIASAKTTAAFSSRSAAHAGGP
jgi:hypothetical protein